MTTIQKQVHPDDKPREASAKDRIAWEITLMNEGMEAGYCEQYKGTDKQVRARMQTMVDGCRKLLSQGSWGARADQVGSDMPNKRKIIL